MSGLCCGIGTCTYSSRSRPGAHLHEPVPCCSVALAGLRCYLRFKRSHCLVSFINYNPFYEGLCCHIYTSAPTNHDLCHSPNFIALQGGSTGVARLVGSGLALAQGELETDYRDKNERTIDAGQINSTRRRHVRLPFDTRVQLVYSPHRNTRS